MRASAACPPHVPRVDRQIRGESGIAVFGTRTAKALRQLGVRTTPFQGGFILVIY